jgi:hypothetical protein
MLQLYQVAYGLFIAVVVLVIAILTVTGVVGAAYKDIAWAYIYASIIVGGYVTFRFIFGNAPFDSSQGLWKGVVKVTSKSLGGEE